MGSINLLEGRQRPADSLLAGRCRLRSRTPSARRSHRLPRPRHLRVRRSPRLRRPSRARRARRPSRARCPSARRHPLHDGAVRRLVPRLVPRRTSSRRTPGRTRWRPSPAADPSTRHNRESHLARTLSQNGYVLFSARPHGAPRDRVAPRPQPQGTGVRRAPEKSPGCLPRIFRLGHPGRPPRPAPRAGEGPFVDTACPGVLDPSACAPCAPRTAPRSPFDPRDLVVESPRVIGPRPRRPPSFATTSTPDRLERVGPRPSRARRPPDVTSS